MQHARQAWVRREAHRVPVFLPLAWSEANLALDKGGKGEQAGKSPGWGTARRGQWAGSKGLSSGRKGV
jgi:hypothetical protein